MLHIPIVPDTAVEKVIRDSRDPENNNSTARAFYNLS